MPTITPSVEKLGPLAVKVTWAGMATGDTIIAHAAPNYFRGTVQAAGTFAGGTAIGITGSIDGSNFIVASDAGDAPISGKTAAFISDIGVALVAVRPTIASGSSDSVTVTLIYGAIG
jgi:hypothetical protein